MILIKKNILILFGSPRENGYTRQMINKLKFDLTDYNIFEFNAYKDKIQPCIGCDSCKTSGKCFYDDFKKIDYFFKVINPEILIIATPIYNFGFPAPLKAIIDRLQPYYYNPENKTTKKNVILLLSSGRKLNYKNEIIKNLNIVLKPLNFKIIHSQVWDETDFK